MVRKRITGDATGIALPECPEDIADAPEAFLSAAMQAYGTLEQDNAVARVTRFETFAGGNSGRKLILDVEYAKQDTPLPKRLFAKFSRDLDDAFRDRRRAELDAEIRIAHLSRLSRISR